MIRRIRFKLVLRLILYVIIMFFSLILLFLKGYTFNDFLNTNCVVDKLSDLQVCLNKNDYFVDIKTSSIINPNYVYSLDSTGDEVSMMLDLGIKIGEDDSEGYVSLIGIVGKSQGIDLLNQIKNGSVNLKVHLEPFTNIEYIKGFNHIKQSYINYYTSEDYQNEFGIIFLESDINDFVLDINFDNYDFFNTEIFMYIYMVLFCVINLVIIFLILNTIIKIIYPYKCRCFNKLKRQEVDSVLSSSFKEKILFNNGYLCLDSKYFYIIYKSVEAIGKIESIVWVYSKLKKKEYYLVLNTINKNRYEIKMSLCDIKEVLNVLKRQNKYLIVQYNSDISKKFKKNPRKLVSSYEK